LASLIAIRRGESDGKILGPGPDGGQNWTNKGAMVPQRLVAWKYLAVVHRRKLSDYRYKMFTVFRWYRLYDAAPEPPPPI